MPELRDLYQDLVLDHCRSPRNCRPLPDATHVAETVNTLCGDRVTVYLRVTDGRVAEVGFQGAGCAISQASASLMSEAVAGLPCAEAGELAKRFILALRGAGSDGALDSAGSLAALQVVREFPARVNCALVPWEALRAALEAVA